MRTVDYYVLPDGSITTSTDEMLEYDDSDYKTN